MMLGGIPHPAQTLDIRAHRLLYLNCHPQRRCLQLWTKGPGDKFLTQRLAKQPVDLRHTPLPSWPWHRDTAQHVIEEIEAFLLERRRQIGRSTVRYMPTQVRLDILKTGRRQYMAERGIEFR